VLRSGGPLGRCQVCRGSRLSPLCLLPATRRPQHCDHRSNGMRATDQGHARAPCARTVRPKGFKVVSPPRGCNHESGSPAAARLSTLANAAQRAEHRSEPAAEPSFFTPHAALTQTNQTATVTARASLNVIRLPLALRHDAGDRWPITIRRARQVGNSLKFVGRDDRVRAGLREPHVVRPPLGSVFGQPAANCLERTSPTAFASGGSTDAPSFARRSFFLLATRHQDHGHAVTEAGNPDLHYGCCFAESVRALGPLTISADEGVLHSPGRRV
jgi:hypothetical protein